MVRRCVKKSSGQEYAAKIINTKKLSARGTVTPNTLTKTLICACLVCLWCEFESGAIGCMSLLHCNMYHYLHIAECQEILLRKNNK